MQLCQPDHLKSLFPKKCLTLQRNVLLLKIYWEKFIQDLLFITKKKHVSWETGKCKSDKNLHKHKMHENWYEPITKMLLLV